MNTITVEQIRLDPAAFVQRIEAGEALVVLRDNRPVAEVKPVVNGERRPYGLCAGEFVVPDDFDAPLPDEVLDAFEGR
jgi:antitoxin (DNA-binding transcriptional repressor) of toxin-antitoxin stability system